MDRQLLVVLAGRPGTGKTTLASRIAQVVDAVYLRIDAIETAAIRWGLADSAIGFLGYAVAHEIVRSNLVLGKNVIVDAVNPVSEARQGWQTLAAAAQAQLVQFETFLPDHEEHRRRVMAREPDLLGQVVPTWAQVQASGYEAWDERRDGARIRIDMTDADSAVSLALTCLSPLNRS